MSIVRRPIGGIGPAVGHGSRFATSDVLLPISVILWIIGVRQIHPSPVPLSVLPAGSVVVFLAGYRRACHLDGSASC